MPELRKRFDTPFGIFCPRRPTARRAPNLYVSPHPRRFGRADMTALFIVGGGLFGSLAAAYARRRGIETTVFDPGLSGAASHAAAGLFKEEWAGKKLHEHYRQALPLLDDLFGIRRVSLTSDDGTTETLLFVPPTVILEKAPVREAVTAVGDGWLDVAAGVWCEQFLPGLGVHGRAGSAIVFAGERPGRIRQIAPSRQAIAF